MVLINSKKGFVFSVVALFFSLILFSVGQLFLENDNYSSTSSFIDSRLTSINSELEYFQNSYLKNALEISLYNTLNSLVNYTSTSYSLEGNYTKLNSLVLEGLINGSFEGISQDSLQDKTFIYYYNLYKNNFDENFQGNFTYKIESINIYEDETYFVSLQVKGLYKIYTNDNISNWEFEDNTIIKIPIYSLLEPKYFIENNKEVLIRPVELFSASSNWSINLLNETLNNYYSYSYTDPTFGYSIGSSYINSLINFQKSSYKNVLAMYTFDDVSKNIKDNTRNSNGTYNGNTLISYNFNSENVGSNITDISGYNNDGLYSNLDCSFTGIQAESCFFNSTSNIIIPSSSDFNSSDFSFSFWIKTDQTSNMNIFNNGNSGNYFSLSLNGGILGFQVNDNSGSGSARLKSEENISDNSYKFITISFNKDSTLSLYVNSQLEDSQDVSFFLNNIYNLNSFYLGNNSFEGFIDEFMFFKREISQEEVNTLYLNRMVSNLDNRDSLYGKSLYFDGKDDYVSIPTSTNLELEDSNFSISLWVNFENLTLGNGGGCRNILIDKSLVGTNNSNYKLGLSCNDFSNLQYYEDYSSCIVETNSGHGMEKGKWNNIILIRNQDSVEIYVNSKKLSVNTIGCGSLPTINSVQSNLFIGMEGNSSSSFFNGEIDEIKIFNYSLSQNEILLNYYNYNSIAKGCCNYLNLINPNDMNFNDINHNISLSYSTKLFYDYYNGSNIYYNITLFEIENLTSKSFSENYYNLKFDICLMDAFEILSFIPDSNYTEGEENTGICAYLIQEGIY